MKQASSINIVEGTIDSVESIAFLSRQIPEFDASVSEAKLVDRLKKARFLILIAQVNHNPVGFKIGYAIDETCFYSWLGGVLPEFRQIGIANLLTEKQELWAKTKGFHSIKVKSMNRFQAMLQMLIKNHYHIIGYEDLGSSANSKIIFQRKL